MTVAFGGHSDFTGKRDFKNLRKKYFSYLIPAVITEIALSLNEFVDSLVVANLLGGKALSIVNLAAPVLCVFSMLNVLLGIGGATLYAVCKGNHDREGADALFSTAMTASAIVSVLLMFLGICFAPQIAIWLDGGLSYEQELTGYLRVTFLGAMPIMLTSTFAYFLPAGGHPILATTVNIVANVVNLLCDFVYIGLLGIGVNGAAYATLTGYALGFCLVMVFYVKKGQDIGRLRFPKIRKRGSRGRKDTGLRVIIATGAASAVTQTGYVIKYVFCNRMAAAYAGQTGVLAFTVCMQILSIISIFLGGLLNTMTPFLGVLKGMRDGKGAKEILRLTSLMQLIISAVIVAIFEIWPDLLIKMYAVEAGAVAATVTHAIRIFSWLILFRWIYLEFRNVATVLGRKLYAFFISIADGFVFLIPLSLVLCPLMGVDGLWWAFLGATWMICAGIVIINWRIATRSERKIHAFWLIPEFENVIADLTVPADTQTIGNITTKIEGICRDHGMQMSRAMLVAISVEEMIVITEEANQSGEIPLMDVLIRRDAENMTVDLRSVGSPFNPTALGNDGDFSSFEMLRRISMKVTYEYVLGMNTTKIVLAL